MIQDEQRTDEEINKQLRENYIATIKHEILMKIEDEGQNTNLELNNLSVVNKETKGKGVDRAEPEFIDISDLLQKQGNTDGFYQLMKKELYDYDFPECDIEKN